MCHFIFVGVRDHFRPQLHGELSRAGFETSGSTNPALVAAFPTGDVLTVVTQGGCSCGLWNQPGAKFDEEAERLKYRKKGWSPSKIERAVLGRRPRARPSVSAFRDAFAGVVRAAGSARIMAHCFSGDVETELVSVLSRRRVSLDDFLAEGGSCADDVVHDVVSGRIG